MWSDCLKCLIDLRLKPQAYKLGWGRGGGTRGAAAPSAMEIMDFFGKNAHDSGSDI